MNSIEIDKMIHNDESIGVWDRDGGTTSDSGNRDATAQENRCFGPIIGIDLGSSNSCVSLWHTVKNRAKIVKNATSKSKRCTYYSCALFLIFTAYNTKK